MYMNYEVDKINNCVGIKYLLLLHNVDVPYFRMFDRSMLYVDQWCIYGRSMEISICNEANFIKF